MTETQQMQRTGLEQVQEDAGTPEVSVSFDPETDQAQELQGMLEDAADSFTVTGFKCAHEECGLVHGHATNKHRTSDSFDVSPAEASEMEANPNCHCGLNEAAHEGLQGAPDPTAANEKAPIPESMSEHLS